MANEQNSITNTIQYTANVIIIQVKFTIHNCYIIIYIMFEDTIADTQLTPFLVSPLTDLDFAEGVEQLFRSSLKNTNKSNAVHIAKDIPNQPIQRNWSTDGNCPTRATSPAEILEFKKYWL